MATCADKINPELHKSETETRQVQKEIQSDSLGECQVPALHLKKDKKLNKIRQLTMKRRYSWLQNKIQLNLS